MEPAAVKKHIGRDLPEAQIVHQSMMVQAEKVLEHARREHGGELLEQKDHRVDDQQVLHHGGQRPADTHVHCLPHFQETRRVIIS